MPGTRATVTAIYDAYARRDIEAALALCHDDMCFVWNSALESMGPFSGACHGKPAFLEKLMLIDRDWELLSYRAEEILCDGDRAAARVAIEYRRRATGDVVRTQLGHFWSFREGKAERLIEFFDSALMREHMD